MHTATPRNLERISAAVRALGERPACLFAVLLAVNALAFPYSGFVHDARLYGVQVLNRLEVGAYSDDLFFRFGNQDQYSIFSQVTAPLIGLLGLPWGFFLLYLVCNALLILATQRFFQTLIKDRLLSTLALLLVMVMPLGFGGLHIFHVYEPFLTPRILANALVLFGLEQMLRGRTLAALGLCSAAALMHPLMAVGGVAVVGVWLAWLSLPRWVFACMAGATALGALALVADPSQGSRVFGQMDDEWLRNVLVASPYNFPAEWSSWDWTQATLTLGIAVAVACGLSKRQPQLARLAAIVFVVAAGGLAATVLASVRGYTLLFQGQPYRALWIARLLQPAFTLMLASALWQLNGQRQRLLALALLGSLGVTTLMWIELTLPLLYLPVAALACRGLDPMPRRSDWLPRSLAISLVLGLVTWAGYRVWLNVHFRDLLLEHTSSYYLALMLVDCLGPAVWMLAILAVVTRVHAGTGFCRRLAWVTFGFMLAVQLAAFVVPQSWLFKDMVDRHYDDNALVDQFLKERSLSAKHMPCVYWPGAPIEKLWLERHVLCFYERLQIQGVLFSRQTAAEGLRRARLVRHFELAKLKQEKALINERWQELLEDLYQLPIDDASPTQADLQRLCFEPGIDYVMLKQSYPGLFAASNGKLFIYDCKQVLAALGVLPPGQAVQADAANPMNKRPAPWPAPGFVNHSPRSQRNSQ